MANSITYADLDKLLKTTGFQRRALSDKHVAYDDERLEPIFLLPLLPPDEPVWPHHLAIVRRWLLDHDLMNEDDYDRWVCRIRFSDDCDDPVRPLVGSGQARNVQ